MFAFPSLYFSTLFMVCGSALLTTYLALYLSHGEVSTTWIGLLTSCYYLGLVAGSKVGYWLISRVGHIRSFAASTAIISVCVSIHALSDAIGLWLALRFIVGVSMMCNFMVLESWLNDKASAEQRGQVFAAYMIMSYLGTIAGQMALGLFPELGIKPILLISICYALCIVPIAITKRITPQPLQPTKLKLLAYWKEAPQALTTVLFVSMISGSFYGLTPAFAGNMGLSAQQVSQFMSVTILAGLLAQYPVGKLSDIYSRSRLIRINASVVLITSALLWLLPFNFYLALVLTFIYGLVTFTLYPLASALANSRMEAHQRVGLSACLLITFGVGASSGSFVAARLMQLFGNSSLHGFMTFAALLMLMLVTLINQKQKAERVNSDDYIAATSDIVSSPLASALDPRVELAVNDEVNDQAPSEPTALHEADSSHTSHSHLSSKPVEPTD